MPGLQAGVTLLRAQPLRGRRRSYTFSHAGFPCGTTHGHRRLGRYDLSQLDLPSIAQMRMRFGQYQGLIDRSGAHDEEA